MFKKLNDKVLQGMAKLQTAKWKAEGGLPLMTIVLMVIGFAFLVGIVMLATGGWTKLKDLWNDLMGTTFS